MINDLNEVNWCYLLDPTFELINSAGKPLTDGWIEVYIHGTRSKYYCASDFDGTLHPFKIPLDSLGANIVLASPAHAYDVYVYNKYGSLVMSRYNVVPATGDAEVITDTTVITSNDGTVQVASSDQTNWDLSIADTIAPVTADVDEHDRQITQIEHDISDIQSVLSNKKDKQQPYSSEGGVTQTITKVEQDSNGNINVTYSDIDLPPEVPTVEITSPNGTMNIASSIDIQTNTKTFEIDVKNSDPVWHYWTGRNAWTYITNKTWTQINRPAIGAGSNPHSWNPTIKRGIYDTKAHFTVTFHNADNSKTVPNQIIQVGFRAKFVGKNDPTAIRYEDLGAWTYDPTLYSDEPYEYNFAQSSMRQNNDTSCILNVANYWGDTEFDVFFEAALINTDGEDSGPSPIDTVLMAEINYFGYHEIKGTVQSTGGGGREYSEGSGIDITDDTISVKAGEGLTFVENKLIEQQISEIPAQVQSDWTENDSADPAFIQHKPAEKTLKAGAHITITDVGTAVEIASEGEPQVQSDWNENDSDSPAYIQNKPDLSDYATNTDLGSAVDVLQNEIDNIPEQVQSNWNESDTNSPAYIQNKPDLSSFATVTDLGSAVDVIEQQIQNIPAQEQADWTEADSSDPSYIQNKPTTTQLIAGQNITITDVGSGIQIDAAGGGGTQVQSNWNENDSSDPSYIQNKPDLSTFATVTDLGSAVDVIEQQIAGIPTQVQSDWTEDDPSEPSYIQNKPTEKNLVAGTNVTITETNDDVIVETTEIASGAQLVAGSGIDIQESNGQVVISSTGGGSFEQVQSNWNESDTTSPAYILNKPTIPADKLFIAEYNSTTYNEIWSALDAGKVAVLERRGTSSLNEPYVEVYGIISKHYMSIEDDGRYLYVDKVEKSGDNAKVRRYTLSVPFGQSDYSTWSSSYITVTPSSYATKTELGSAVDVIEQQISNIPAQVQSDWNESDTSDPAYIENKPATTALIAGQNVTITDVGSGVEIAVDASALATKTDLASAIDIVEADIPTKTSDLQNDSGFITSSAIPDLNDLNTAGITDIQIVNALPASPVATVLYLVRE